MYKAIQFLRKFYPIELIIGMILFYSCNNQDEGHSHSLVNIDNKDKRTQKYIPGLHLKVGAKYIYTISSDIHTQFKANGKDIESTNSSTAGLLYEAIKDSADSYLVKMTYNRFHLLQKTGDNKTELDADNGLESLNPAEKMLGLLKIGSIFITVTHDGRITKIAGYKELVDTIINSVNAPDGPEKENMRTELSAMLGENFVTGNIQQAFGLLPDSALQVGDTWHKKQNQADLNMDIDSHYTLSSIDDDIADIGVSADIDNSEGSKINMNGYTVDVQLHGKQEGNYKLDMNSGLLTKGNSEINLKGTMGVLDKLVPIHIIVKKEITLKKLN